MASTPLLLRLGAILTLAAASSGCALFHAPATPAAIRPVSSQPTLSPADADYAAAVGQIERRDYAAALELLQSARAHNPRDARVLNAFGVIYDKLGRFDLSARYYAQAQTVAPDSPVVRANLAYSQELQRRGGGDPLAPTALARATPAAPAQVASAQVAPARTVSAPAPAVQTPPATPAARRPLALRAAYAPLEVVNATGSPGAAEPVRASLARRGWATSKARTWDVAARARTTIYFPHERTQTARALSRTLPQGAQLVACQAACRSLRLIVGQDARRWAAATGPAAAATAARG